MFARTGTPKGSEGSDREVQDKGLSGMFFHGPSAGNLLQNEGKWQEIDCAPQLQAVGAHFFSNKSVNG